MLDYANSQVYKIVNDVDKDFYIGSTTARLCDRMANHRKAARNDCSRRQSPINRKMRELGVEHFKIVLLEKYPCDAKQKLLLREQYWIDILKPALNRFKAIETRSSQQIYKERYEKEKELYSQRAKAFYQKNSEAIKAKNRIYAANNQEKINQRASEYRQKHAREIKEKKSKVYNCACGGTWSVGHGKPRHEKTKKHQQFLQTRLPKDGWRLPQHPSISERLAL